MASNRTIVIKGNLDTYHEEARASEICSPGHLVEQEAAGTYKKRDIITGNVPVLIIKEDGLIGGTITTAYAVGDLLPIHVAQKGDILHFRVAAAAAAIVKGAALEVAANGLVAVFAAGVKVAIAEEAVDNSAGGAEAFVKGRVI